MARPKKSRANAILVAALACGATKESAAHQAGVSVSTVHRRLADPEFCRQLQEFESDIVQRTARALTAAGLEFVKTLVGLAGGGTPPATRLGAVKAGLELGMKLREAAELEPRLAALEEQVAANASANRR
jgi:hypothetical protein